MLHNTINVTILSRCKHHTSIDYKKDFPNTMNYYILCNTHMWWVTTLHKHHGQYMISSFIKSLIKGGGGGVKIIIINSLVTRGVEKNQRNHGLHIIFFVDYPLMLYQYVPLKLTNAPSSLVPRFSFLELTDNPILNLQTSLSSLW